MATATAKFFELRPPSLGACLWLSHSLLTHARPAPLPVAYSRGGTSDDVSPSQGSRLCFHHRSRSLARLLAFFSLVFPPSGCTRAAALRPPSDPGEREEGPALPGWSAFCILHAPSAICFSFWATSAEEWKQGGRRGADPASRSRRRGLLTLASRICAAGLCP